MVLFIGGMLFGIALVVAAVGVMLQAELPPVGRPEPTLQRGGRDLDGRPVRAGRGG